MYKIDYKEIGARIRSERRKQNLTQEQLSEKAGISESFLGLIERGGRTLSIETMVNLANALNLSIEFIISGEYNYRPGMIPSEIHDCLKQMTGSQRRVFVSIMKTLAAHSDMWPV